ncbi:MAG: LacI family DNA-binding transcriptional regulator [Chloroflexota bacterium]|nr:LacI family DNA-binding transcriptional regulator [Chloroflexota bacterium]
MAQKKPNMRDVAQAAEVSLSTVWMVIHKKPGISRKTVDRVRKVIDELGYEAKSSERRAVEPARTIGLLIEESSIPAISDVFYGDVIRGIQAEADALDYQLVLSVFKREMRSLTADRASPLGRISGLVIANDGDITPAAIMELISPTLPVVLIESHIDDAKLPCVLGDNFYAGYEITNHVLDLGHRRVAVLRGPTKYSSLVDRLRGCLAAIAERKLPVPEAWLPAPIRGHPLKGYMQMREILADGGGNLPSAVIAISDKTAFGAMEAIREFGLRIPEDISIASIDNTRESAFSRPPLTTVQIPKYEIGVLALRKLHDIIEGRDTLAYKTVVYSELILRESTRRLDSYK